MAGDIQQTSCDICGAFPGEDCRDSRCPYNGQIDRRSPYPRHAPDTLTTDISAVGNFGTRVISFNVSGLREVYRFPDSIAGRDTLAAVYHALKSAKYVTDLSADIDEEDA